MSTPSSHVIWDIDGPVATVTFNRPETRNALTWEMYDALVEACDRADASPDVRVLVIRGAGGAFASGTDISQFRSVQSGEDGVAYERRLEAVIDRIERVGKATIAEVDGAAVGGGCAIALACDLRICSDRARFGVPVARTLGNCLSIVNTARLVEAMGQARTRDLLLTGRLIDAAEALALGVATRVVPAERVQAEARALAVELSTNAPSTIAATKKMLHALNDHRRPPAGSADDILRDCYGSAAFREGVAAFLDKRPPRW